MDEPGRTAPPTGAPPGSPAASGGDGGQQPGKDVPDEPTTAARKRGPHPDSGQYVVFAAEPVDGITVDEDGGCRDYEQLKVLGFFPVWWGEAEGQREAKQAALDALPDLKAKTEAGGTGVWLLAPPLASARPKLARAEQPPPIMRGL